MKKVISCLLVCILLLSCIACGENSETEIALDQTELELPVGGSYSFKVKQGENEISSDDFDWKSSDESIAMVVSGKVVALKTGSVIVTATSDETILSCVIVVLDPDKKDTTSILQTDVTRSTLQTDVTQTRNDSTKKTASPTKQNATTPAQAKCNHQYTKEIIAPTCISQGYTKHVCKKCNHNYIDDYREASATKHSYSNYKCKHCGGIDKTHTYEHLINWILENGKKDGNTVTLTQKIATDKYTSSTYGISYHTKNKKMYLFKEYLRDQNIGYSQYAYPIFHSYTQMEITSLSKTYPYEFTDDTSGLINYKCSGTIESATFILSVFDQPISCDTWESRHDAVTKEDVTMEAHIGCNAMLQNINRLLQGEYDAAPDSGLTIKDLGFTVFLDSLEEYGS